MKLNFKTLHKDSFVIEAEGSETVSRRPVPLRSYALSLIDLI